MKGGNYEKWSNEGTGGIVDWDMFVILGKDTYVYGIERGLRDIQVILDSTVS